MKKIYTIAVLLFVFTLQGQNKLLSNIQESYYNDSWHNANATNYEYDNNNNLISETNLEWDNGINVWKIKEKVTYTYNSNYKVTQEIGQVWNAATNSLENGYRDTYSYGNAYGDYITEQIAESWNSSQWINDYKLSITYNGNGLADSATEYSWNGSNWINAYRTTLTYNSNYKIIIDLYQEWVNAQWENSDKAIYTYNINSRIVAEERARWDKFNALWKKDYSTTYDLDIWSNRIRNTYTDDSFQYKEEYTYDTTALLSNFAHPFRDKTGIDYILEDLPYFNKVLTETYSTFNKQISSYENNSRTTYNYNNSIVLGVENAKIASTKITVYPNPTSSILYINPSEAVTIDKVVVVDITGKTVLHQNQNSNQINIEKLAKGFYIIEAYSGNKKLTSKFVKE
jgi:hypothetical protein